MTKLKVLVSTVCAFALLVGAQYASAAPGLPAAAYVKQGPALCVNPSGVDGGLTATYCTQMGPTAGDLQTTMNAGAGATGNRDDSALYNAKLGKGLVAPFGYLNGTAPTFTGSHPLTCERVQYVIASGTVGAGDAGFKAGPFNAAPYIIGIVIDSTDGGAWVQSTTSPGAGCTASTTGLTCSSSANVTTTLGVTVCGQ